MKKILKNKWLWTIIIIIIIVAGIFIYYGVASTKQPTVYTTEEVKRGNLTQTVTATGAVESAHEINLSFDVPGKLANIKVKEGDLVKTNQELARLDTADLQAQISQAKASLRAATANLQKIQAGSSVEDVKVSEEQVNKMQSDLNSLVDEQNDQLINLGEKNIDSITSSLFSAKVALDKVNNYLINEDTTNNLAVIDSSLSNNISAVYSTLSFRLSGLMVAIEKLRGSEDNGRIISLSEDVRGFLSGVNDFLNDSYRLADGIILNSYYSQTIKDTIKADLVGQQTANNAGLSAVQTAKSNLTNAITSYKSQIDAAQKSLNIYNAQLSLKKAGPRSFDVEAAQASVDQARAQLAKLNTNLDSYVIKAPIDGKISKVNFLVGEQTSQAQPIMTMLGSEKYEIKVDIAESDIAKLKIGNVATIDLDAFGSDHIFSGHVTFIEPASTVIKDVIYYRTTISFDQDSWNDQIKAGMTANITIVTAEKPDVIYIPQRAVKIKEAALGQVGEKYVKVLVGDQPQEKAVSIGLRADNGLVEVISGVNEGDRVITFEKSGK
ncbi:MAG: efflux RND transporter periplasmic adaptor subunit [Patescibacteria group bacterium]